MRLLVRRSKNLSQGCAEKGADVVAILDRDKVLQGKEINGIQIIPYKDLVDTNVDMVLVATANTVIEPEIVKEVRRNSQETKIFTFTHKHLTEFDRPVTLQYNGPSIHKRNQ